MLDWLLLFLLALIWGGSFMAIKRAVRVFEPIQMSMWRMVLSSLFYLPIAAIYWKKIDWRRWRPLVIVAFCGSAIPNFLFATAQRHVDSGLAGVLNSLTPLFTLVLGVLFFQMTLTRWKILGVALGLAGAVMLILFNGQSQVSGNAFYAALCALATVCYAINANSVNAYLRDQHPAAISSAAFMLTGWLFALGLWRSGGWQVAWEHPDGLKAVGYVFYLAALGTVVGNILYFSLIQRAGALFAASTTYLLPVVSLLIGVSDGEQIGLVDVGSMGVILAGLYLARR